MTDSNKDARARGHRRALYVRKSLMSQQTTAEQVAVAMARALKDIYQKARPRSLTLNGPVVDYSVEAALIDALRPLLARATEAGIKVPS